MDTVKMIDDINRLAAKKGFPKAERIWSYYTPYDRHFDQYRYHTEEHTCGNEVVKKFIVEEKQIGWSDQWQECGRKEVPLSFNDSRWREYVSNNRRNRSFNWQKEF